VQRPRVLVLGGLDPCGGAGITADARVLELFCCHALTVATCLTVQNRHGFARAEPVAADLFTAALRAAVADGPLQAVKIGLVADAGTFARMREVLAALGLPVVVDPVLTATAGGFAGGPALAGAYAAAAAALAAVMTPNLPELAQLAGAGGAAELLAAGCAGVVVTGGHASGDEVVDEIHTKGAVTAVRHRRAACGPVHGTGCAFASATVAGLAHGAGLLPAATRASGWVGRCLVAMAGAPVPPAPRPFVPLPPAAEG